MKLKPTFLSCLSVVQIGEEVVIAKAVKPVARIVPFAAEDTSPRVPEIDKGKVILPQPPAQYIASRMSLYRFLPLAVQISHAALVYELPPHHNDPFD
jgi:antitoxin (DNA-binding transcriptional repressor) of toxin-antitoxin stability system